MSTIHARSTGNPFVRAGRRLLLDPTLGVVGLLVIIIVGTAILLPVFLTGANLYNLLGSSIPVMILAMGMTVVLISGGIDLSIGSVMALSAGVAATALVQGLPLFMALLAALAVGVVAGLLNGLLVTRLGLPDFIATLAMAGFAAGILYIATQGVPIIGYMIPEFYVIGGLRPIIGPVTAPMIIALVLAIILGTMLKATRLGTHFFAVGSSATAAMQSGVRVNRIRMLAYVVSGITAAIAGIILAGRTTTVPADLGVGYEVNAIAAAVVGGAVLTGGRGRILGAILGAITLAVATNLINLAGVPSSWRTVVIGTILLLAVMANRATSKISAIVQRRQVRAVQIAESDVHPARMPG
jgi:ribose transport system permease protein